MKKYICLNHGECNWADEKPPREFALPEHEENACPNCESANIRETEAKTNLPWLIPALAVGLLSVAGLLWWALRSEPTVLLPPLKIEIIGFDCKSGILSLTTTGGDGSPVTLSAANLNSTGTPNEFVVPIDKRINETIRLLAQQSAVTSNTTYHTACPPPPPGDTVTQVDNPPIVWTTLAGSGYCDPALDGTYFYSEKDNLGRTREQKTKDPKCYPAVK